MTSLAHLRARIADAITGWRQSLLPAEPEYDPPPARKLWLLAVYTIRRWLIGDRCSVLAASLTVQTLLSVVPTIGVLLFFIGLLDPAFGTEFVSQISHALAPDSSRAEEMAGALVELATNVRIEELGRWGLIVVIVLAFMLFSTLEHTINEIWRVSRKRNLISKFTMFYTLASLGPIVVFYSLAQPLLAEVAAWVVTPLVTSSVGLTLLYRFLPNQTVRWWAAMFGGLVAAILFEVGKFGFGRYLSLIAMSTYEGLYGSLAIMPVFVVWAYFSWMIVLLGAEVTFVVHNAGAAASAGYMLPSQVEKTLLGSPGRVAARLLLAIAEHQHRNAESTSPSHPSHPARSPGLTLEEIDARFDVPLSLIHLILDQLEETGFVCTLNNDKGYVVARPFEHVMIAEVLELFDGKDRSVDTLDQLFAELDEHQRQRLGELTLRDCVEREIERIERASAAGEPAPAISATVETRPAQPRAADSAGSAARG